MQGDRNITVLQTFMKLVVLMGVHGNSQRMCAMADIVLTDSITTAEC
jgi:hypothetical protein